MGGFKYAWYNLGVIPVVLFSVRHIETRKEAIGSGLLAGLIGIIPGIFLYLALLGQYPDIINAAVPTNAVLSALNLLFLQITFQVILFGTLIETGTGLIFAVNERVSAVYVERGSEMPQVMTTIITLVLLCIGIFVAQFGLIGLIAKGYGTMTWGFFLAYVVPLMTVGVYKILKKEPVNEQVTMQSENS